MSFLICFKDNISLLKNFLQRMPSIPHWVWAPMLFLNSSLSLVRHHSNWPLHPISSRALPSCLSSSRSLMIFPLNNSKISDRIYLYCLRSSFLGEFHSNVLYDYKENTNFSHGKDSLNILNCKHTYLALLNKLLENI